jgi:hypothetical protein
MAWLRVIAADGVILFDCEHNGCTWKFDWKTAYRNGSAEILRDLCATAYMVVVTHRGSTVDGYFLPDYERYVDGIKS